MAAWSDHDGVAKMRPKEVSTPRKISKYQICERHAPWFDGQGRRRTLECMVEGGPGGWTPGCSGGLCQLWPGTDVFEESVCHGWLPLEWTEGHVAEDSEPFPEEAFTFFSDGALDQLITDVVAEMGRRELKRRA